MEHVENQVVIVHHHAARNEAVGPGRRVALSSLPAHELGAVAIKAALERAKGRALQPFT